MRIHYSHEAVALEGFVISIHMAIHFPTYFPAINIPWRYFNCLAKKFNIFIYFRELTLIWLAV